MITIEKDDDHEEERYDFLEKDDEYKSIPQ
jgi:hypothetical protein